MDGVDRSRGWTHPYQPPFRGPSHDCYIGFNAVQVHVVDHPLAAARLTTLRDERTDNAGFRAALRELTLLLIYEATRDAPCEPVPIRTPLAETVGSRLTKPPLLVPVLRAGLGMVDEAHAALPEAHVGFVGVARDEQTHQPVPYLDSLPDDLTDVRVMVLDPMVGHRRVDDAHPRSADLARCSGYHGAVCGCGARRNRGAAEGCAKRAVVHCGHRRRA